MKDDPSKLTALIVDGGLFQPLAHVLAPSFKRMLYYREARQSFPTPNDEAIGNGYKDIERVESLLSVIKDVDLFIFPDLYWQEEQECLRSLGKLVFGSGVGEDVELWRCDFYEDLKAMGLPVVPFQMVTGMKELRKTLEKLENKWIKVSYVRGLKETWRWIHQRISKPELDELEASLGALSEDQEFMIQDDLESKREIGSDQIIVNGKFPKTVQWAIEGKDKTCLATMKPYAALPIKMRQTYEAMDEMLKPIQGYFSSEMREAKDGKLYFTDPCCRHASPAGEPYNLMVDNLADVILAAAQGEIQQAKATKPFAAQALICSGMAEQTSIPVYVDPKARHNVFLYHSGIRPSDGQECVFKTDSKMKEVGSVIGTGRTIDEAISECQRLAKMIECCRISIYTDELTEMKAALLKP